MILNTKEERADKLFDYVQTILKLEDSEDLKVLDYRSSSTGFHVDCEIYKYDNWCKDTIVLTVADILLMEFTKSNNND